MEMDDLVKEVKADSFGIQANIFDEVDTSGLTLSSGSARWTRGNSDIDLGPELVRLNNPGSKINVNAQVGQGQLRAHIALTSTLPKGFKQRKIEVNGPEGFPDFVLDVTKPNQVYTVGDIQPRLFHTRSNQQDIYRLHDVVYRGSFTIRVKLQGKAKVLQSSGVAQIPGDKLQSRGNFGTVEGECVYKVHYN